MAKEAFKFVVLLFLIIGVFSIISGIPTLAQEQQSSTPPDLKITIVNANLHKSHFFDDYSVSYQIIVTNVGDVDAYYHYDLCLCPWGEQGPSATGIFFPDGTLTWVDLIESGNGFLKPGQSYIRTVGGDGLHLGTDQSNYINTMGGVSFTAAVEGWGPDGTHDANLEDNVDQKWMDLPPLPPSGVGGIVAPIDKLGLLAPYIGLASTAMIGAVASTVYVKRVKRRKEKQ